MIIQYSHSNQAVCTSLVKATTIQLKSVICVVMKKLQTDDTDWLEKNIESGPELGREEDA